MEKSYARVCGPAAGRGEKISTHSAWQLTLCIYLAALQDYSRLLFASTSRPAEWVPRTLRNVQSARQSPVAASRSIHAQIQYSLCTYFRVKQVFEVCRVAEAFKLSHRILGQSICLSPLSHCLANEFIMNIKQCSYSSCHV